MGAVATMVDDGVVLLARPAGLPRILPVVNGASDRRVEAATLDRICRWQGEAPDLPLEEQLQAARVRGTNATTTGTSSYGAGGATPSRSSAAASYAVRVVWRRVRRRGKDRPGNDPVASAQDGRIAQ